MEYIITSTKKPLNLHAQGADEILQNVYMILNTPRGSVPLNRAFGLDMSPLDMPLEIASARMATNILEALQDFEPRATLINVDCTQDHLNGKLNLKVKVSIDDEYI